MITLVTGNEIDVLDMVYSKWRIAKICRGGGTKKIGQTETASALI